MLSAVLGAFHAAAGAPGAAIQLLGLCNQIQSPGIVSPRIKITRNSEHFSICRRVFAKSIIRSLCGTIGRTQNELKHTL
jgi:hypothetical protein